MRKIARWTIGGNISKLGWRILKISLERFKKFHKDFEIILFLNNIKKDNVNLKNFNNFNLFWQKEEMFFCKLKTSLPNEKGGGAAGSGWKIVPPRIDENSFELWIDNDILFEKKLNVLDDWTKKNSCIISEGKYGIYGNFQKFLNYENKFCAGFFGIPPKFNFESKIKENIKYISEEIFGHYDEQGLVAKIITDENFILVRNSELQIVEPHDTIWQKTASYHLVGSNRSDQTFFSKNYFSNFKFI